MIELFLRNLGIYTVIYFVFRKAAKQMVDKKLWVKGLIPTFGVSFIILIGLIGYL